MTGVAIEIPVRWGDMDALGHVNNTVLFQYCESARIAYFERCEAEAEGRVDKGPRDGPGLVQADLSFRKQVVYPGTVRVETRCTRIGGRSFTLAYTLRDAETTDVVAEGSSVCVWVDYAAGKALDLPEALVAAIVAIEGDPGLATGRTGAV